MFAVTQSVAVRESEPYLLASTALSELGVDVVRVTSAADYLKADG
jgi:hypothetical protein